MHNIAFVPGAGNSADAMWPIQAKNDRTIYPIDYERGSSGSHRFVLQEYAQRVFEKIRSLDTPVDLYGWSMGAPISLQVAKHADKHATGLVRNVVMITPGVFHGEPQWKFHRAPLYGFDLWSSSGKRLLARMPALEVIQGHIPDFAYKADVDFRAMHESGDGVIKIPRGFDRSRIRLYYAPEDDIIPEDITLHMAKRAGIKPIPILGFGHQLPLLDTDGTVLSYIRERET